MSTYGKFPIPVVEESLHKRLKMLLPVREELGVLLDEEVRDLQGSVGSQEEKEHRLMAIVDRAAELVAPSSGCQGKKCSHCCYMAVGITEWEARRITEHTGIPHHRVKMDMDEILAGKFQDSIKQYHGVPCVFLKKGECSIYDARPVACRLHFNMTDFPELCDVLGNPGSEVPNINFTPLWAAAAAINLNESFGDLREFFPDGTETAHQL